MTMHPELRFVCNRCGVEATMGYQQTPTHQRESGPDGWMALKLSLEPGEPVSHFCPACKACFDTFMANP